VILDSSAIVAVFLKEPGHEEILRRLAENDACGIGAPTLVETTIVLASRLPFDPSARLQAFLVQSGVQTIPFGEEHARDAAVAYARYGKGRHPAALNFGDCLSYAVAKLAGQPLLCTGGDFAQTDLELA
jgi:ribonuclease VapC